MNASGDPSVCLRCSLLGPTCCNLSVGQEEVCFPLSVFEKERLQDFQPDAGGFALEPNSSLFVSNMIRLFPGEEEIIKALFPSTKFHFRLAVDSEGKCRFLGTSGCTVPSESRPYYCRLYPFWFSKGEVTAFASSSCLAVREGVNKHRMFNMLGVNAPMVRDLYGRLRLAWGLPPCQGMKTVKKGF